MLLLRVLFDSEIFWVFESDSLVIDYTYTSKDENEVFLFICSVRADISDCCKISGLNDIMFSIGLGFLSTQILFPIYI